MTGVLEVFIHRCTDSECGGVWLNATTVKRVKLTLSNGKRLVFDSKEDALAAAEKHGVAVTLGERL